jgi:hypothetical protein
MPIDLTRKFEKLRQQAIKRFAKQIKQIYEQSILEISITGSTTKLKNQPFSLNLYPLLNSKIESTIDKMHQSIYQQILNSVQQSWDLSNKKNDQIIDKRLAGKKPTTKGRQILYDPNKKAYDAFISRREKGLNLSKRVWNTLDPFKKEMEQALGISIAKGQSATSMATELKKYLNDPDKLFRKVRNEEGKLVLSKAAREYHPGQGVYRSSYKNALRLSREENNRAYRSADHERWQQLPFVIGIRVKTSGQHPKFDICDHLAGLYPKEFKFKGWHIQCICFQVPEMLSDEEFEKIEDQILAGEQPKVPEHLIVKQPPAAFGKWVKDNQKRIDGWKNKPSWYEDNKQFLPDKPLSGKKGKTKRELITKSTKPSGKAIRLQFTKISGDVRGPVEHALDMIDSVHGDGDLLNIPFYPMNSKTESAQFVFKAMGQQIPVAINVSKKSPHPEFSIIHEMGHYFDLHAIGRQGSFASGKTNSPLFDIMEAADQTENIKEFLSMKNSGTMTIDGQHYPISKYGMELLDYYLDPAEIWARAYSQFIVKRSDSKIIQEQLSKLQKKKHGKFLTQWEDKDFEKLEKEIEKMMIDLGWMTNQL